MNRGQFSLFGIPVTVDPMFILGIVLLSSAAGSGRTAVFTGVSLALFTLIHELGHAATARSFGCRTAITLSFLVGFASYTSDVPLSRGRRALISLMGPATQLITAAMLLAIIHQRMDAVTTRDQLLLYLDLWDAVLWGGVILALLNLVPLWPLDGGHLAGAALEATGVRDAARHMAKFTLAACGAVLLVGLAGRAGDWSWLLRSEAELRNARIPQPLGDTLIATVRGMPSLLSDAWFVLLFCGFGAYRTVAAAPAGAGRWIKVQEAAPARVDSRRIADPRAMAAERQGWHTGHPATFPEEWGPSPWLRAHLRLEAGDVEGARAELASVTSDGQWVAPEPTEPGLAPLVPLLPQPLAAGDLRSSLWALEILGHHGPAAELAHFGSAVYQRHGDVEALYLVAAGFTRQGHHDDAMVWLRRAADERPDPARIGTGKEFRPLHDRLDFQQLLVSVRRAPAA